MKIKRRSINSIPQSLSTFPPILQRIFASRSISNEQALDKSLSALLPFELLTDIDKACERLHQALQQQQRILIIGDFDADGATSTTLAVSALRAMKAKEVAFLVPNRFQFGYGLTPAIVDVAKKWQPDLIITVDNGIASFEGVEAANAHGIDVLITDHHLPAETLPAACAIVNPNQQGDRFPSKSIAGVGVIFYVMLALRRYLINQQWFEQQEIPPPNMAQMLDLVALGTVADVVGLDQNNRILVSQGLARIRQGNCRAGIKALVEIAGRKLDQLRENDLGFAVAPRLNAAGRLDDMSLGIECLLCEDSNQAKQYAQHLDELNLERRHIESEMKEQALLAVGQLLKKMEHTAHLPIGLCLMDDSWHQGVIGILAGRLKEKFHRPVIIFAVVSETELKGSARSVPGLNIRDVLAAVDKDNPGLITKFGGHAMAAGLSMPPQSFIPFRDAFIAEAAKHLNLADCEGQIWTDGALAIEDITLNTAQLLQQAGPWGQQFPEPCFDDVFTVIDQRIVGQNHLKLSLAHPTGGDIFDAIAFNVDTKIWPNHRAKEVHIAYKLDINSYQGRTRLQLMVEALMLKS